MSSVKGRRHGRKWGESEIARLITAGLLEFRPEEEIGLKLHPVPTRAKGMLRSTAPFLRPEIKGLLEAELAMLARQHLPETLLRRHLWSIMGRCLHPSRDFQEGAAGYVYLCYRLGLDPLSEDYREMVAGKWASKDHALIERLSRPQMECFQEWVEIPRSLWTNGLWRGCMLLYYGYGNVPGVKTLPASVRKFLDRGAEQLRGHPGPQPSAVDTSRLILGSSVSDGLGEVRILLANTYLRLKAFQEKAGEGILTQPLRESGLFEMLAEASKKPPRGNARIETKDFLRYLKVPSRAKDHLVGQVIYYLLLLDDPFESPELPRLPSAIQSFWPEVFNRGFESPPRSYERLVKQLVASSALRLPQKVFDQIWAVHVGLVRNSIHWHQRRTRATVFWASRFVHALRPDVCAVYHEWIDFARKQCLEGISRRKGEFADPQLAWCKIGLLQSLAIDDPLLNCVLHDGVFNGRQRLIRRSAVPGPDRHIQNYTIAVAYRLLRSRYPRKFPVDVTDAITDLSGPTKRVREAVTGNRGRGIHAYLMPLAAALYGSTYNTFTTQSIKDICSTYGNAMPVKVLLRGLGEHAP